MGITCTSKERCKEKKNYVNYGGRRRRFICVRSATQLKTACGNTSSYDGGRVLLKSRTFLRTALQHLNTRKLHSTLGQRRQKQTTTMRTKNCIDSGAVLMSNKFPRANQFKLEHRHYNSNPKPCSCYCRLVGEKAMHWQR